MPTGAECKFELTKTLFKLPLMLDFSRKAARNCEQQLTRRM
jgi:hypothetical protein